MLHCLLAQGATPGQGPALPRRGAADRRLCGRAGCGCSLQVAHALPSSIASQLQVGQAWQLTQQA